MDAVRKTLPEQHYLYVGRQVAYTPEEIAEAFKTGFGEVYGFINAHGITPTGMPCAVYVEMPSEGRMAFRAAFFVGEADAAKAEGTIKADKLTAGDAFVATHVGGYSGLGATHKALWDQMEAAGVTPGMPVWEIYVDDPTMVSEAELKTEIYRSVGG